MHVDYQFSNMWTEGQWSSLQHYAITHLYVDHPVVQLNLNSNNKSETQLP